jgi:hypothetical protein
MVLGVGLAGAVFTTVIARGVGGASASVVSGAKAALYVAAAVAAAGMLTALMAGRERGSVA